MQDYVTRLMKVVETATPLLMTIEDEASARQPAPNKWSAREIVGHLIDSASNNHQRFVRAQFTQNLIFPGYEQDRWVDVQHYRDAPWHELVTLWAAFNRHIARVMSAAPEEARMKPRRAHNLHQLASKPIPESEPATLDYFMRDYVGHLEHHLEQILGTDWSVGDRR